MKRKHENHLTKDIDLLDAAQSGNLDSILYILRQNPYTNINVSNSDNETALCLAAAEGHLNVVQQLLKLGANYKTGPKCSNGEVITPLDVAACNGHMETVKLILSYPQSGPSLRQALHYSFGTALKCQELTMRNQLIAISDLIKKEFEKIPKPKILGLADGKTITWDEAFKTVFLQSPSKDDRRPKNKDAAIRNALVSMFQLLQNPAWLVEKVQFLSQELEYHWKKEQDTLPFPKFDQSMIDFWDHEGMLWPIPNDKYQGFKKHHLLSRVLADKFKQYGMGESQSKWTGFIPLATSKKLLLDNAFFTENRKTISGLFHGNVHNIQRVILLFAIESHEVPLCYCSENGNVEDIEPKDIFSALMRKDILLNQKNGSMLWSEFLDSVRFEYASFSHPHRMHTLLLTEKKFSGFLQDYLLYSFCDQFIHMRDLHNHVYKKAYSNSEICKEIEKIMFEVFNGLPEFAIQMDKTKNLELVETIDTCKGDIRWHIQPKSYHQLTEHVKNYCDLEEDEQEAESGFQP